MRAREVMTSPALTVRPDAPVKDAAQFLAEHRINEAPVVDESGNLVGMVTEAAEFMLEHHLETVPIVDARRVVGIVSRRDILPLFVRSDVALEREVRAALNDEIKLLGEFEVQVDRGVVKVSGRADRPARELVERLARSIPGVVDVDVSGITLRQRVAGS